jgi:hypothetical protein
VIGLVVRYICMYVYILFYLHANALGDATARVVANVLMVNSTLQVCVCVSMLLMCALRYRCVLYATDVCSTLQVCVCVSMLLMCALRYRCVFYCYCKTVEKLETDPLIL